MRMPKPLNLTGSSMPSFVALDREVILSLMVSRRIFSIVSSTCLLKMAVMVDGRCHSVMPKVLETPEGELTEVLPSRYLWEEDLRWIHGGARI